MYLHLFYLLHTIILFIIIQHIFTNKYKIKLLIIIPTKVMILYIKSIVD